MKSETFTIDKFKKRGSKDNPSFAITIPKWMINEKRIDPEKETEIVIRQEVDEE